MWRQLINEGFMGQRAEYTLTMFRKSTFVQVIELLIDHK